MFHEMVAYHVAEAEKAEWKAAHARGKAAREGFKAAAAWHRKAAEALGAAMGVATAETGETVMHMGGYMKTGYGVEIEE